MDSTNRNSEIVSYDRQLALDDVLGNLSHYRGLDTHYIIGCGGIGFWLGILLAMNGCTNIYLFDADKIEHTNLNRIPVPPLWVGHNKAVSLKKMIMFLRPDAIVMAYTFHVKEDTLLVLKDLIVDGVNTGGRRHVWDTTDNAVDQRLLYKMCKELRNTFRHLWYRKIGYEGFEVGSYAQYDVWFDPATYQPGYRTTRANATTSVMAAGLGLFSHFLGQQSDVVVDLRGLIEASNKKKTVTFSAAVPHIHDLISDDVDEEEVP